MLQLKANLLRKESAYEPRTCVVEKVIPMYGRSFEQFRQDLLEDNLCIHKHKDLMYIDPENNVHCLLFVDQNSGDGILVESEGSDYARYSQYIPNAQAIIQQSEQTQAEQKLHGMFRNISEQIANDLHNGKTSFCLQDYMEKTDLEELIRGSVRELLDRRGDIQQVQDISLDVPFQPDFQITAKPVQELKFYCPLTIHREPEYDEEYDYGEEYPEIPSSAAAGCADAVQKRLEGYCSDDGKRGLMEYYDREKSVSEKVYSAVPSVTVRDGELVGMYTCQVHGELNGMELEELRDYLTGQSSDGVGEGFEQREIKTAEYGNIYVSFWNDSDEWSLLTEEKLEQQKMEESMGMSL